MRTFWGFYDNGTYRVGCNGATIYVYDQDNRELGRFKDIPYAYDGAFQPGTNIFAAKSTEGLLAFYDLEHMKLLNKTVITRIGSQDDGFAFSPDGAYFYNIERPILSTKTQMTVYRTTDYGVEQVLFPDEEIMVMYTLEFDDLTGEGHVLGFMRGEDGSIAHGFIGKFTGNDIVGIKEISIEAYDDLRAYKRWERSGYTKRVLEWCSIKYHPRYAGESHISLKQVYDEQD